MVHVVAFILKKIDKTLDLSVVSGDYKFILYYRYYQLFFKCVRIIAIFYLHVWQV